MASFGFIVVTGYDISNNNPFITLPRLQAHYLQGQAVAQLTTQTPPKAKNNQNITKEV
jgi:hypothetical protein